MYTVYAWKTCGIHAGMWIPLANFGNRSVWVSEELSAATPQYKKPAPTITGAGVLS